MKKSYGVKISKLVCTFVKDYDNKVVFLSCNYFEVENYSKYIGEVKSKKI